MATITVRMDTNGDGQRDVVVNGVTIGYAEKYRICGVTEWKLRTNDKQNIHCETLHEVREVAAELYGDVQMVVEDEKTVLDED